MILLLMAGLAGIACDSVSGTPVSADAVVLELTPTEVVLAPGKSTTLQAKAKNSVGVPVQLGLKWQSSDPEIVTVDGEGNVTALRAGEAEVQVAYGKSTGSATVRVTKESGGDANGVASVTLTPGTASLKAIGDTVHLTASALSSTGAPVTGAEVSWASLDEMVATVSAGTVVARGNGTARITATAGGKADTATVAVAQAPVSVSVMPGAVSVLPGQSVQLAAVAVDANGVSILGHSFTWASENEGIATVEAGMVVAVASGSTVVRATSGSLSGVATIAVQNTPVATVAVSPASGYIEVGQTGQLTVTLKDASGKVLIGRAVSWTSSNSAVATVSATGAVTGASVGTTTISATSEGKTGTATLEVRAPAPAPVASVAVSPGTATVEKEKTLKLSAVARDASGNVLTGRAVTWSSSNAAVASVSSSGVVTGVTGGTATIVATSEGKTGAASITVTVPATTPAAVASVQVSPGSVSVEKGKSVTFSAVLRDASGNVLSGRTISWTSSNPAVATISSSGVASAVGAGTATIAGTSEGKTGYATMTVTEPSTETTGLLASHDFEDGTFGAFAPYGTMDVVSDPTPRASGKVARISYSLAGGKHSSQDHYLYARPMWGYGVTRYFSGRFFIPETTNHHRKLVRFDVTTGANAIYLVVNSYATDLKVEGWYQGTMETFSGTAAKISAATWHQLEVQVTTNSAPGAADGTVRLWLDGRMVYEDTSYRWLGDGHTVQQVRFGEQLTVMATDVARSEYRYWDDVRLSSSR